MTIRGIMLVKDEVDIIRYTLAAAEVQFDRIYVMDNGSNDGTWELVNELASDVVHPWKRDTRPYSNALRADVFNAFRTEAEDGDWWCYKMDADEFYVDDPRDFLSSVPRGYHTVYKRSLDYVLTDKDLKEHDFVGDFGVDRPYIRYFKPQAYTEARFFKHRRGLSWEPGEKAPRHMGIRWHEPITVRHYQWRSPEQIQRRLDLRRDVRRVGKVNQFRHITQESWREVVEDHREMVRDRVGFDYGSVPLTKNLKLPPHALVAKRILHGIGLFP